MSIGHDIAPLVLNKKTDFFQEAVFVPFGEHLKHWHSNGGHRAQEPCLPDLQVSSSLLEMFECENHEAVRTAQHLESLDSLKDKAVEYFRGWLQYYTVTQYCYF